MPTAAVSGPLAQFGISEDSWESASIMAHITEAIEEFHKRYPSKPKPHCSRARS